MRILNDGALITVAPLYWSNPMFHGVPSDVSVGTGFHELDHFVPKGFGSESVWHAMGNCNENAAVACVLLENCSFVSKDDMGGESVMRVPPACCICPIGFP